MKIEHKNFIGMYYDVYPEGYCQHLINEFDRLYGQGAGSNRQQTDNCRTDTKDDHQIGINIRNHVLLPFVWKKNRNISNEPFVANHDPCSMFFDGLQKCWDDYSEVYSVLKRDASIQGTTMKMQKTSPGGGYHIWHSEQAPGAHANRVAVYMLYLNTVGDGAETEFLYQKMRVKPQENLMLIWPAGYTHVHRGNPVLENDFKYIITGWFYYE